MVGKPWSNEAPFPVSTPERFFFPGSAIIRKVWLDAMVARAEG
jgi:hypothetical protein